MFYMPHLSLALALALIATTDSFTARHVARVHPDNFALEAETLRNPPPAASASQGGVHGLKTLQEESHCKCYTDCPLLVNSPEIQKRLAAATKTRAYPLFLAEKAAKYLVDDIFDPPKRHNGMALEDSGSITSSKEKIVVLGAGWGSAAFLKGIDTERYDVTIISPRNFFLFTPMLAGSAVGTVDIRSITQPIREFNTDAKYLEAAATKIDTETGIIHCASVPSDENDVSKNFEVPYDRLVVAVGARSNTFGIPGVEEHCHFLKEANHARAIRRKIVDLFEKASLPGTSEDEIRRLLTFAIIGAGPTGTETAAELRDFVEEDGPKFYPELTKYANIEVIEASPTVLGPFDKTLQKAAIAALTEKPSDSSHFSKSITHLNLSKRVKEVKKNAIQLEDGTTIPYGIAIWAGGIGPLPLTLDLINTIGGRQKINQNVARGKLAVDPWMRVIDGKGRVFAVGDCACNQGGPLPATAQVAAQEGEFLAHILNSGNHTTEMENGVQLPPKRISSRDQLNDKVAALATGENEYLAPFQYLDLGILAYTGHRSALAQIQVTPSENTRIKSKGALGFSLWRSIYLVKQSSVRNQMLIAFDWTKSRLFGRDITRIE
ncbi:MAG: hypothetical protein SGILL_002398 [Bacillariaceae sp.]